MIWAINYIRNKTTEIEKRNKIEKKGERGHLGHLPAYLPGPAPPAAQPTWPPSPVFLPCQRTKQLRAGRTRVDAGHLLLRRGSLPDPLATPRRRPRPPSTSSLSLDPLLLLCSPPLAPEHARRRRPLPPRPPGLPRFPD